MVYSAQRLLHHFYFCYVQVAAFAVSYVTVDCNIEDLGCFNVAEIRVEVLLGEICKTLLPIATVTRVCLRQTLTFCRMEEASPVFNIVSCIMSSMSQSNEF